MRSVRELQAQRLTVMDAALYASPLISSSSCPSDLICFPNYHRHALICPTTLRWSGKPSLNVLLSDSPISPPHQSHLLLPAAAEGSRLPLAPPL